MKFFRSGLFCILLISLMAGCGKQEKKETANSDKNGNGNGNEKSSAAYVEQASFQTLDGDTVALSDYKGKVVMIDFWETWCKPCLASFPTMQKLMKEYPEDFVVLAVTPGFMNSKEEAQTFAVEHEYGFEYLYDENKLHEKLGVQGIPFKVYVDAKGNFVKTAMGSYGPKGDYKDIKEIIEKHKSS